MADTSATRPDEVPMKLEGNCIAMAVCWILGFGSLVCWNSMLTIGDYYYAVFPDYHPSRVLTLVYQPFAIGVMAILAYNESKVDTRKRNIAGYIIFFICSLGLIVIDLATSGKGGIGNYIFICLYVAGFGVADAHVQGGMVGDLSFMKPEFMQSFFAGLAASGAVTSGLRLTTKAVFDKSSDGLRKGTMLFLAISTFFEFLCIFLYAFVFAKLPIVKYYRTKAAREGSKTVSSDLAAVGIHTEATEVAERLTTKQLLIKNLDYGLDLYLIYVLTLSIFPGFLYENTGTHQLGSWYPLVLIAMYNILDLIGRYTPLIQCTNIESRKWLMIAIISRFLFIPAFYFTAKYGDQGWMIMLVSLLGLTNGHLTVCVMTIAPKGYTGPEANALGNILVLFLLAGIFSGVALDWLWIIEEKKLIFVADKMRTSISFSFRRPVRGGIESQQHDHLSVLLDSVILPNMEDRCFWDLNGDGVFHVKDVRILLDEAFLSKMEVPTRWIKSIPIKEFDEMSESYFIHAYDQTVSNIINEVVDETYKTFSEFVGVENTYEYEENKQAAQKLAEESLSLRNQQSKLNANSWQWDFYSSGNGNTFHWQWELILPVGTLSWQWECLVHFILNINYQVLSPSAPNALLKTPSTVATSSSSIDSKLKSLTSSTSPSTNGYLTSTMSPPPRVPSPPLT
nr:equilibrative nucleotide transporter 3-like [Tanacetum cinerariifolium]